MISARKVVQLHAFHVKSLTPVSSCDFLYLKRKHICASAEVAIWGNNSRICNPAIESKSHRRPQPHWRPLFLLDIAFSLPPALSLRPSIPLSVCQSPFCMFWNIICIEGAQKWNLDRTWKHLKSTWTYYESWPGMSLGWSQRPAELFWEDFYSA